MTTRKRALTAQIKPATRNAIMDQLALAADEIQSLRINEEFWRGVATANLSLARSLSQRRWWHRFAWWRK